MLYLAFIFHMHQPYYRSLINAESPLPWVRLHGSKDYLDMVEILKGFPHIHQTFNIVPSLIEQIESYTDAQASDSYLELSRKNAHDLSDREKAFILNNFFSINKEKVISLFPRYLELYFKNRKKEQFNAQDYLDLQLLFNLAWIDPYFRAKLPQLKQLTVKGRFFSEEDKRVVLEAQFCILKGILPGYREAQGRGQVEFSVTPYYHPILPLLATTNSAKEANLRSRLPSAEFKYPQDAKEQVESAVKFYKDRLGAAPSGMWSSEESVSERIIPFIIESGIKWIVTDEAILFKSLKKKKRDTKLLYQPHLLERKEGSLNIVFRDRNLSDLIGFVYHSWKAENAVDDFLTHLENINKAFCANGAGDADILVTIAMDGENAWEYFANDGHDFLGLLYQKLSESKTIKTTTVSEYLKEHPAKLKIKHLATGSWIYGNFDKWMNNPAKAKAWDWLLDARKEVENMLQNTQLTTNNQQLTTNELILKQMYILEGSDWFWWYGEDPNGSFDKLFRMHLTNLYTLLNKEAPGYLRDPLKA
jgi:alpha-amylase/alpha-mannosidase (GH57 family)